MKEKKNFKKLKYAIIGVLAVLFLLFNIGPYLPMQKSEGTFVESDKGICVEFDNGFKWTFYDIGDGAVREDEMFSKGDRVQIVHNLLILSDIELID